MLPQSFTNNLKDKVNLINLVSEYTALSKADSNIYIGRCDI